MKKKKKKLNWFIQSIRPTGVEARVRKIKVLVEENRHAPSGTSSDWGDHGRQLLKQLSVVLTSGSSLPLLYFSLRKTGLEDPAKSHKTVR